MVASACAYDDLEWSVIATGRSLALRRDTFRDDGPIPLNHCVLAYGRIRPIDLVVMAFEESQHLRRRRRGAGADQETDITPEGFQQQAPSSSAASDPSEWS